MTLRTGVWAVALLASGCGTTEVLLPEPPPPRWSAPKYATVETKDVRIVAEDGAWEVAHGREVAPPFRGEDLPFLARVGVVPPDGSAVVATWSKESPPRTGTVTRWSSREEARKAARDTDYFRVYFEYFPTSAEPTVDEATLAAQHGQALQRGARTVLVHYPGLRRPLFGVLALGRALATADREVQRVYRIVVPRERVQAALRGEVALVCQPYDDTLKVKGTRFMKPGPSKLATDVEEFYKRIPVRGVAWALWLSKTPLGPPQAGVQSPGAGGR